MSWRRTGLALLLYSVSGLAQTPEIVVGQDTPMGGGTILHMHRAAAEAPLGDGWHQAESTQGGFHVQFPGPYNDFRVRSAATDGVAIYLDAVGMQLADGVKYSAVCTSRADGALSGAVGDVVAGLAQGKAGATLARVNTPLGPAVDLTLPGKARIREVRAPGRSCMLTVEAQGIAPLSDLPAAERFVGSLRVTGSVDGVVVK